MLHTLNRAWAKILIRQASKDASKRFLFIHSSSKTTDEVEKSYFDILEEFNFPRIFFIDSYSLYGLIAKDKDPLECFEFEIWDDILVSKSIHDPFLLSYLNKHCKRKSC